MTYLVDSDYIIDYLKGQLDAVHILTSLIADGLAISIITFTEVYEGIYYGRERETYEVHFKDLLRGVSVLGITRSTARRAAIIRGKLRKDNQTRDLVKPKDTYDLFIAATAMQYDLTMLTRNTKDYNRIPGLKMYQ